MRKFQVNEDELGWAGFLIDVDAQASVPFLARASLATARYDSDIVQEAWTPVEQLSPPTVATSCDVSSSSKAARTNETAEIFGDYS
jgi:hypothetical protein